MSFSALSKTEIFARLADSATVITPNRRLALALKRAFDAHQQNAGLSVWASADVLPFGAFIQRAYQESTDSEWPLLLTPLQAQHLWEGVVKASAWGDALLAVTATAAQCADAWQLAQAWRIQLDQNAGNEDAQAFAAWARAYAGICARDKHTDAARLPDVVINLVKQNATQKPKVLIAYAFDVLTPQQRDVLTAYQNAGSEVFVSEFEPALQTSNVMRVACNSPREELQRAAQWARARLERNAGSNIAVVVPELEQRRAEIEHTFNQVLNPGGVNADETPAFNVSLGLPLTEYPLVAHALAIFDIAQGGVEFADASQLLRSPFIAGAEAEFGARALLDVYLREHAQSQLTLPKLLALINQSKHKTPALAEALNALYTYAQQNLSASASPQQWARHFSALLENAGFPGERTLDSAEFQTRVKLNETFAEFARLERVVNKMSYAQARAQLRRLCADTVFQPESGDAPIQVLGLLEAAGMSFDHLWLSGLTDEAWPLAARPHPFIAPALQKKAGVPQASSEKTFELAKRMTQGWLVAAPEVVVSHALRDGDRELSPSPLIAGVLAGELKTPAYQKYQDVIHQTSALETFSDDVAPAFAGSEARGGTRVLADQAACPFRAYAHHRLQAHALEVPQDGLDALARGILLHKMFEIFWKRVKTQAALLAMSPGDLNVVIADAAQRAMREVDIKGRLAELEAQRLTKLAHDWLEVERGRAAFEVVEVEQWREQLDAGGLKLHGKIDRIDKLNDGSYALIDYKTSKQLTPKSWLDERPDDPQLPLYAINEHKEISAVAFARVRVGMTRFYGFARDAGALPGTNAAESWEGLFEMWRREIAALGQGFLKGDARVAPKKANTCAYCDLQPLCRVHELLVTTDGEEDE